MTKSNTEPTRVQPSELRLLAQELESENNASDILDWLADRNAALALRAAADELDTRDFRIDCLRLEHDEMAERLERARARLELTERERSDFMLLAVQVEQKLREVGARLQLAEDVCKVASRAGISDSGFTGEHDPDDMHDLRAALAAWRAGAK